MVKTYFVKNNIMIRYERVDVRSVCTQTDSESVPMLGAERLNPVIIYIL